MKNKIDVTIAIVAYKSRDNLRTCLRTVIRYTKKLTYQIFVVDNASGDGTARMVRREFPGVKLIVNRQNIFATRGNNQVLKQANSRYCLILNPDIVFLNNAVLKLFLFLEKHAKVAGVTCRQILPQGETDIICSRIFTPVYELVAGSVWGKLIPLRKKIIGWYRYFDWMRDSSREVEAVSDILLLVRTEVLRQVGFYDDRIKLFFMEDDLSLRIRQAGYRLWYFSKTKVRHIKGASVRLFSPPDMYRIYESDMLYYYRKHFGYVWFWLLRIAFLINRVYYRIKKE